ncbi:MAG: SDR family NAD(P)-dependent oxidoreductase [Streptosporangiaceae bacterium]
MTITLITGANKGLGYETARQLIESGQTVYIGARSVERGEKAAAELGARFVQLDVTDDASAAAAMSVISDRDGHLDVLVNNAGIGGGQVVNGPAALTVFDTNAIGESSVSRRRRCRCSASPLTRWSSTSQARSARSGLSRIPGGASSITPPFSRERARRPSRWSPSSTRRRCRRSSSMRSSPASPLPSSRR